MLRLFVLIGLLLAVIFTIVSGYRYQNLNYRCCDECNRVAVKKSDQTKTCLLPGLLSQVCKTYYANPSNRARDLSCASTRTWIVWNWPTWLKWPQTRISLKPLPGSNKLALLKQKYGNTVWSGTITGSHRGTVTGAGVYNEPNYTLKITNLKIDFNSPDINNLAMDNLHLPTKGQGTYVAGPWKTNLCDTGSARVSPATINLNLVGEVSFDDNSLDFIFDDQYGDNPDITRTCTIDNQPFNETSALNEGIEVSAKFNLEGNNLVITGCDLSNQVNSYLQSKGDSCKVSGQLKAP